MVPEDWLNVGLTMILIFGLLTGARYLKVWLGGSLPKWSPWAVLLVYNGLWTALVLADKYTDLTLPAVVVPVGIVGGNAALITLFGLPGIARRPKPKPQPANWDPDREKIVPAAKKKRHKKSK